MFVRKKAAAALGASLIALSAVTATAMPADAIVEKKDGGKWSHGSNPLKVWSNYYHPKKRHGSSVEGIKHVKSRCVGKKKWSRASTMPNWFGGNHAWYYFC